MGNFTGFQKLDDFYLHPRLGQIKRIQKQEGPQMIQHKVLVESQTAVQEWLQSINKLSNSPCSDIILFPKSHFYQRIGYCGRQCQVFMLFDDYMFSLKDQIRSRRKIKRHFVETSVWQILYKLVKAESFLQKLKLRIGNVKPQNFLVNQQGQIKIISKFSWPNAQSGIMSQSQENINLYSPEQIREFKLLTSRTDKQLNQIELKTEKSKQQQIIYLHQSDNTSQIFSIGITLLQICTMQQSKQMYKSNGVDEKEIIKRLSSMKTIYSNSLVNLMFQMLVIDEASRIKVQNILSILKQHEHSILNHKPFEIKYNFANPFFAKNSNSKQIVNIQSVDNMEKYGKVGSFLPFLRSMRLTQSTINKKIGVKENKNQHNISLQPARTR